ncbi:hypothetical protein D3C72_2483380 [compost metagenome]
MRGEKIMILAEVLRTPGMMHGGMTDACSSRRDTAAQNQKYQADGRRASPAANYD